MIELFVLGLCLGVVLLIPFYEVVSSGSVKKIMRWLDKDRVIIPVEHTALIDGLRMTTYYLCPNCNHIVDQTHKFCPGCAKRLGWFDYCPHCFREIKGKERKNHK